MGRSAGGVEHLVAGVREGPLQGPPQDRVPVDQAEYETGPGRGEDMQAVVLDDFVRTVNAYRGAYGIEAFNWFGLRDNNSEGPNFQSFFGLLRDDYSRKPAFAVYRDLIAAAHSAGP